MEIGKWYKLATLFTCQYSNTATRVYVKLNIIKQEWSPYQGEYDVIYYAKESVSLNGKHKIGKNNSAIFIDEKTVEVTEAEVKAYVLSKRKTWLGKFDDCYSVF